MSTSPLSPPGPERPFGVSGRMQRTTGPALLGAVLCRLHLPSPAEAVGPLLAAMIAWHGRWQQRRALARLDARMLKDIGLTRDEMRREVRKPFWRP